MPVMFSCLAFLLSLGIYLHGALPTTTVGDAGEFITAAHTLGIPHPPGFPAYVLFGKAFLKVLPWANVGYRMNVFSVLCGAVTAVLLCAALRKRQFCISSRVFVVLGLVLAMDIRRVCQGSEVFALHLLFLSLVICAVAYEKWALATFSLALGCANHQALVLVAPAIAFLLLRQKLTSKQWAAYIVVGILGLSIYGWLGLRAGANPFLNIGQPDSIERWFRVVTRANYGSLTLALGEAPARTFENTWLQVARLLRGIQANLGVLGGVAALAGAVVCWRKDRTLFSFLAIALFFVGPFFFVLGNMPFDAQSTGVLGRFYAAPTLLVIVFAAALVDALNRRGIGFGIVAALIPMLVLRPAELWAERTNFVAYSYGRNTLKSLSPNSVLIMDGGDDTFYSLAYLTQVEGRRPDVQLHDRGDVVFHPLYGEDFRSLDRASKESRRQQVELALVQSARPLAYSTMNEKILPGVQLRQQGLLYQATTGRIADHPTNLWALYDLRGIPPWSTEGSLWRIDYRLRALVPFYAFQRAIFERREKASQDSLLFLLSALKAGPDVLWLRPNVRATLHLWAYTNLQQRKPAEAERLYQVLVAVAPEDDTAWLNLGALADQRGDLETSIHCYQEALRISPRSAKAHYNLGAVYWKQGKWSEVVREFEEALRIDPNYPSAGGFLNQARARLAGQS